VGTPVHSDDEFGAKCEVVLAQRPDVVSFTFALPGAAMLQRFRAERIPVVVTVCSEAEAREAQAAGADALVVQGWEAGGHRGGLHDASEGLGLLPLLRLARSAVDLPLVAAGGIADGASVAAVLAAGAEAAMLGTAFLRTPEAGTSALHKEALTWDRATVVTRAFTGRSARALTNDFTERFTPHAVSAYPDVHFLTAPLRAHAKADGDAENLHLWAGQAHRLARDVPAAQVVRDLAVEAADSATAAEAAVGLTSRPD
jgi:nitronate monooxygenase